MGGREVFSLKWPQIGSAGPVFFLVVLFLFAAFEARSEGNPQAASADRHCSVPADTQRWTKQEIFVWERACAGAIADFNDGTDYGGNLDPNGTQGLPESRILRSKFLETILLEDKYRSVLTRRGVRIIGARFKERVDLVNADLGHELWLNDCLLEQGADFSGAKSTHLLSFDGSKATGQFTANWSRIDEALNMRKARFSDIAMGSAHIGGTLELIGSTVAGKLYLDKLHVDSSLLMLHAQFSEVVLGSAHIGGTLELDGSTVSGQLHMDKLHVDSSLFMRNGQFREIVLGSAHIGGTLELNGSTVNGPLHMDKLQVDSSLLMRTAQFREVVLGSAHIIGTLELTGSTVRGRLYMDKLRVDSSLYMRNNAELAEVNLTSAHIGGQLDATDAKVTSNLQCYNLTVEQDVLLNDAKFTGKIDCRFSKFKNLYFNRGTFGGDVDLANAEIGGEIQLGPAGQHSAQWSPGKALILRNARAETIPMLTDAWPAHLDVGGFTYRALREDSARSHDQRSECRSDVFHCWFEKQKSFSPQAYEQLAQVFQNQGNADQARAIRYDGRERERSESEGLRYAWLTILDWVIGYGHQIERALGWTVGLVIVGAFVLGISGEGRKNGMPVGLSYSFDMLLPIIKLRDAHYDIDLKGWPRYYFYAHKIAGFVLASFLVAGISGLTR
jgi:hypothetical protein